MAGIFEMNFGKIYKLYLDKVERKGRREEELKEVIFWLTGHDEVSLAKMMEGTVEQFFKNFPKKNPNAYLIKGRVCRVLVEEIADPVMKNIRLLDKLVDELSLGRPMEKILRQ